MIERYSDTEFLAWFPAHAAEFTNEIKVRLEYIYVKNAHYLAGSMCNILVYKKDSSYVAFHRYGFGTKSIDLSYIAVESSMQGGGIGFELSCYAIDNALIRDCTHVTAGVSNAAKKLIERLKTKYPEINFQLHIPDESDHDSGVNPTAIPI